MLKKKEWTYQFLKKNQAALACPYCQSSIHTIDQNGITCKEGHHFDISKKGTIHLMKQAANVDYDANLFTHRYLLSQSNFFQPLWDQLYKKRSLEGGLLVDVGCGEGSFVHWLHNQSPSHDIVGLDIAKEGILAANHHFSNEALWCLADLTHLPFGDESCANLFNILTPSHYQEFDRVLTPGGKLLKVVPDRDYLIELRKVLYRSQPDKQRYGNEQTLERFFTAYPNAQREEIRYQVSLTKELFDHLVQMTPLYWGASEEDRDYCMSHPLSKITVHFSILEYEKTIKKK